MLHRARDGTRTGFATLSGPLRWESLPLRLLRTGLQRSWDPHVIDFSADAEDWCRLTDFERLGATMLAAQFVAGEEAVTEDIQPFMAAVAAEGRLEDELYLTQFAFEEATHTIGFRRWMDAVGLDTDVSAYVEANPGYRAIFFEALPRALAALHTDPSPAAQVRASVTYNHVVEGCLALTGYYAWQKAAAERGQMPGIQQLIAHISADERRHMAWGTYTCRRHVAGDDSLWQVVEETLGQLLPLAVQQIEWVFDQLDEVPFGFEKSDFVDYATSKALRRLGTISSARGRPLQEIEADLEPVHLEDRFAVEDARVITDAAAATS